MNRHPVWSPLWRACLRYFGTGIYFESNVNIRFGWNIRTTLVCISNVRIVRKGCRCCQHSTAVDQSGLLKVKVHVSPVRAQVLGFSTDHLFPLYRRFVQAITGVRDGVPDCPADNPVQKNCAYPDVGIQSKKLILFEPMALRNQLDFSLQISKPFTEYANTVFAPHVYTGSFTFKTKTNFWPPSYSFALDTAYWEAGKMRSAVMVTEYVGTGTAGR